MLTRFADKMKSWAPHLLLDNKLFVLICIDPEIPSSFTIAAFMTSTANDKFRSLRVLADNAPFIYAGECVMLSYVHVEEKKNRMAYVVEARHMVRPTTTSATVIQEERVQRP